MASDPTVFSYTIRDELGTEASTLVYASYDGALETVDALIGTWLAYGGLVDAVTGGQIIGGKITIPTAADGSWKAAPLAGSRVEQTVLVNFSTASSKKRQGFDVLALRDTLISAGKVITASGAVKALIDAIVGSFTNGFYANQVGQDLTAFRDAAITFRKHRRQLTKSSEVFTE